MSLTTLARKTAALKSRHSVPPGGIYVTRRGVVGLSESGFSLNGGSRNVGRVGSDMKMSHSGTPFRGPYARGRGGTYGAYPPAPLVADPTETLSGAVRNHGSAAAVVQPVLNAQSVYTRGDQARFVKRSTVSTKGMLDARFRWVRRPYPYAWVQPNYTGNLVDNTSQGRYIDQLASSHVCSLDVNDAPLYADHVLTRCACNTYAKTLHAPVGYTDHYYRWLTRGCAHPRGHQKPFPFAVNVGTGLHVTGGSVRAVGTGCGADGATYLTPPAWYTQ